jgi:membrane protease YdiL (CAAX protease family)
MTISSSVDASARINVVQTAWTGPLTVLFARTGFCILAQVLVTLILAWQRSPDPLRAGTAWWPVTGTLVDLGCLFLLVRFTRQEGIRLADLIGLDKSKLKKDLLMGLGAFLLFPIVMISGAMLSGLLVYGSLQPALPPEVMAKSLPLWAALYARLLWWPVWSVTEELTYNGYVLPRLRKLFGGRAWPAVIVVGLVWAVQHSFLPFIPDARVFLSLFLQMVPLTMVMQLVYLRFRRLPPVILAHWGMDLFSAIAMIAVI